MRVAEPRCSRARAQPRPAARAPVNAPSYARGVASYAARAAVRSSLLNARTRQCNRLRAPSSRGHLCRQCRRASHGRISLYGRFRGSSETTFARRRFVGAGDCWKKQCIPAPIRHHNQQRIACLDPRPYARHEHPPPEEPRGRPAAQGRAQTARPQIQWSIAPAPQLLRIQNQTGLTGE